MSARPPHSPADPHPYLVRTRKGSFPAISAADALRIAKAHPGPSTLVIDRATGNPIPLAALIAPAPPPAEAAPEPGGTQDIQAAAAGTDALDLMGGHALFLGGPAPVPDPPPAAPSAARSSARHHRVGATRTDRQVRPRRTSAAPWIAGAVGVLAIVAIGIALMSGGRSSPTATEAAPATVTVPTTAQPRSDPVTRPATPVSQRPGGTPPPSPAPAPTAAGRAAPAAVPAGTPGGNQATEDQVHQERHGLAGLSRRFRLKPFVVGATIYTDRPYTVGSVLTYGDAVQIRTPNEDKARRDPNGYLTFTVTAAMEVVVAMDARAAPLPDWLAQFTATGERIPTSDVPFALHRRVYPAGAVVDLGGNVAPPAAAKGFLSNYWVLVRPAPADRQPNAAPKPPADPVAPAALAPVVAAPVLAPPGRTALVRDGDCAQDSVWATLHGVPARLDTAVFRSPPAARTVSVANQETHLWQDLPPVSGQRLGISAWVRRDPGVIAQLFCLSIGPDGGTYQVVADITPTDVWHEARGSVAIPANATSTRFGLLVKGTGRAWLDDVAVEAEP